MKEVVGTIITLNICHLLDVCEWVRGGREGGRERERERE